jgi:hypothetical protein
MSARRCDPCVRAGDFKGMVEPPPPQRKAPAPPRLPPFSLPCHAPNLSPPRHSPPPWPFPSSHILLVDPDKDGAALAERQHLLQARHLLGEAGHAGLGLHLVRGGGECMAHVAQIREVLDLGGKRGDRGVGEGERGDAKGEERGEERGEGGREESRWLGMWRGSAHACMHACMHVARRAHCFTCIGSSKSQ